MRRVDPVDVSVAEMTHRCGDLVHARPGRPRPAWTRMAARSPDHPARAGGPVAGLSSGRSGHPVPVLHDRVVDGPVPLRHHRPGERLHPAPSGFGNRPAPVGVGQEAPQHVRHGHRVERVDQEPVSRRPRRIRVRHPGCWPPPRRRPATPRARRSRTARARLGITNTVAPAMADATCSRESRPTKWTRPRSPTPRPGPRGASRAGPVPPMTRSALRRPGSIAA